MFYDPATPSAAEPVGRVWAEEVGDLWEPWMRAADRLLEDDELLTQVFEAQGRRWKQSRRWGRLQTPAEVVLPIMLLKHIRNWSYELVEREVRANLVYRDFTRIGTYKVPDAKTLGRLSSGASMRASFPDAGPESGVAGPRLRNAGDRSTGRTGA
jgi:hypothetical protein